MSWIETPPEEDATGSVAAAYDRDRVTLGYVANFTRVFAHRPEADERLGPSETGPVPPPWHSAPGREATLIRAG